MSNRFIKAVGFAETEQLLSVTAPVQITSDEEEIKIPILVSNQTPANPLGRDALCEMKASILYYPQGMYLNENQASEAGLDQEVEREVIPGELVYIKVLGRKWHKSHWEGPYKAVRATPTVVQVEGSTTRYHLNDCTEVHNKSL